MKKAVNTDCLKSAFAAAGFQPAYQFSYNIAT